MTHDSNPTISSCPVFLSVLTALNTSVVNFLVLWSNVNAEVVNRAEERGFGPNRLLPHAILFWFAAHASPLSSLALGVPAFLAWRRSRSQPE